MTTQTPSGECRSPDVDAGQRRFTHRPAFEVERRTLTVERLRELFSYDPAVGRFVRLTKVRTSYGEVGHVAGSVHHSGYRVLCIDCQTYSEHRLAWLYVTGEWPKQLIDHINRDKADNRFANLREATYSQNGANRKTNKNTITGIKGVRLQRNRKYKPWCAVIRKDGVNYYLGNFRTAIEAQSAYAEAAERLHEEFAHIGGDDVFAFKRVEKDNGF